MSVPSIVATTVVSENQQNKVINNVDSFKKYNYLDEEFDSIEEALSYANSNSEKFQKRTKYASKWSLNVNNNLVMFDEADKVYDYLEQYIKPVPYTSYTTDLQTDYIGALYPNEMSKMNFDNNSKIQTVYRGKDNSIHLSIEDAKKSYLRIHEVYYFNGIFFRTKEELSQWLEQNIENCKGKVYEISFKNAEGRNSLPINIDLLNSQLSQNKVPYIIENFVKTSNKPYFEYEDKTTGETLYISESSINEIVNDYDSSYIHMQSNQGLGNYIIDTTTEDEADFIGPYYVRSGSEINQISDNSKWSKISGVDFQLINDMASNELISKFMNLMLSSFKNDNASNDTQTEIYNFPDVTLQTKVNNYFIDLEKNVNRVYKSIINLFNTMKQGKRYGEFLKTPVLFIHTIDQMVAYNVEQKYIDKTREIYSLICDYYDNQLYSTVPSRLLIPKKYLDNENNVNSMEYSLF
ncbi:MAG: hypothetical protein K2L64_02095, partial [Ureaplasma sp.]|nr:hypothetical protein [Ureaplasma sp.]